MKFAGSKLFCVYAASCDKLLVVLLLMITRD